MNLQLSYESGSELEVSAAGHADHQMLRPPDRHGNPCGQRYRSREKQLGGIGSGDMVCFSHRRHGTLTGYAILLKKQGRVVVAHGGRQVSVRAWDATLLARNHATGSGWRQTPELGLPVRNQDQL